MPTLLTKGFRGDGGGIENPPIMTGFEDPFDPTYVYKQLANLGLQASEIELNYRMEQLLGQTMAEQLGDPGLN